MSDQRKRRKVSPNGAGENAEAESGVDRAFDLWLQRGLHQLYDQVAQEPLPEELLRLIEEDKNRPRG
jgi:hypothetical protein